MKKFSLLVVLLSISFSLFGAEFTSSNKETTNSPKAYNVGDVCDNIEFTTTDGVTTSIYEQVDAGKAVMIFWGQSW